MSKRGKTPSLLAGTAGASKFVQARRKRTCSRGKCAILSGEYCVEVRIPGTMGSNRYCINRYQEILKQSQRDLDKLKSTVDEIKSG